MYDLERQRYMRRRPSVLARRGASLATAVHAVVPAAVAAVSQKAKRFFKRPRDAWQQEFPEDEKSSKALKEKGRVLQVKKIKFTNMPYGKRSRSRRKRRTYRKKRRAGNRKRSRATNVKSAMQMLDKRIKRVASRVMSPIMQFRDIPESANLEAPANAKKWWYCHWNTKDQMEEYLDYALPRLNGSSLEFTNLTVDQMKKVYHKGGFCKVEFRNNNLTDVVMEYAFFMASAGTNLALNTELFGSLDDRFLNLSNPPTHNNVPETNLITTRLSDMKGTIWKKKSKIKKLTLRPTETHTAFFRIPAKGFYDIDAERTHGWNYHKNTSIAIMMCTRGGIWHDETNDALVGYSQARLDYVCSIEYKFCVEAGDHLKHQIISDGGHLDTVPVGEQVQKTQQMEGVE